MNVFLIAAVTADGFIAETQDHLADWTSTEDKKLFTRLTKEAGYMVMGANTYRTIGRALPERHTIVYTNHPEKIDNPEIETTTEAPADLITRLEKAGANGIAVCGGAQIYSLFASAGLLDEIYLTIEPVCFGKGITLFNQDLQLNLSLLDTQQLNENAIMLHYRVARPDKPE
nr:RibD C-terminal domain protein [uncultured bacterium]